MWTVHGAVMHSEEHGMKHRIIAQRAARAYLGLTLCSLLQRGAPDVSHGHLLEGKGQSLYHARTTFSSPRVSTRRLHNHEAFEGLDWLSRVE